MDFSEYQEQARRTAQHVSGDGLSDSLGARLSVAVLGLGIAGEAGEVTELIKKQVGHGHEPDPARLTKELGDVLWYLAMIADAYGTNLDDVARINLAKLRARYPDGFSCSDSAKRVDAE